MEHELTPLIEQVKDAEFPYVVVGMDPWGLGIRWRSQTESACKVIADTLGEGWKVLTKEQFIADLQRVVDEDAQE